MRATCIEFTSIAWSLVMTCIVMTGAFVNCHLELERLGRKQTGVLTLILNFVVSTSTCWILVTLTLDTRKKCTPSVCPVDACGLGTESLCNVQFCGGSNSQCHLKSRPPWFTKWQVLGHEMCHKSWVNYTWKISIKLQLDNFCNQWIRVTITL